MKTTLEKVQFKLTGSSRSLVPTALHRAPKESGEILEMRAFRFAKSKYWKVERRESIGDGVEIWYCTELLVPLLAQGFCNIHSSWEAIKGQLGLSSDAEMAEEILLPWLKSMVGYARNATPQVMDSEEWTERISDIINQLLMLAIKLDYEGQQPSNMPAIIWNSDGEDDKTFDDRVTAHLFSKGWIVTSRGYWGEGPNIIGYWTVARLQDYSCS